MSRPLTEGEIDARLVRLRNLERLHAAARERITQQEQVIADQAVRITALEALNEKLLLRVEELERMVFGRKRHVESPLDDPPSTPAGSGETPPRSPSSYRRPLPRLAEITNEEHAPVDACRHCGGSFAAREEYTRYVEDIDLDLLKRARRITQVTVERGYCSPCGQWTAGRDLRGQPVTLGPQVRDLVCFLVTVLDQTYAQVETLCQTCCGITLTDGEIAAILQERGVQWRPAYERLKTRIRDGPGVHLDETGWRIQENGHPAFGWVMSAIERPDVVYRLADNRGKGNAVELLGPDFQGVRITDGYAAYQNLPGAHQVCWAHLLRTARELAETDTLPTEKQAHVQAWSSELHAAYEILRGVQNQPHVPGRRRRQAAWLRGQVRWLSVPHPLDPKKLTDLKAFLQKSEHALFTCLTVPGIPATNNRAERDLRKLVLKRKKSLGSKTEKGAKALEVILSVCWSLWHRNPRTFFPRLAKLGV